MCVCIYLLYIFLLQPPILILNITVIEARSLEAKDADGEIMSGL